MINTANTRYELENTGGGVWIFNNWGDFLKQAGLTEFDHFCSLTGHEMDRNRGSVVYRLELGEERKIFYLKLHKNYVKKGLKTFFKKIPYSRIELNCMMEYARAGLEALEPVAWGWRPGTTDDISFLLIRDLEGYRPLPECLEHPDFSGLKSRRKLAKAVAEMLATMHRNGLAHIDLFTWHIFVKIEGDRCKAHPIDLERTKVKGNWPWSEWLIRRKQANDLAVLHLTVPWPQIGFAERMSFYHEYCRCMGIDVKDRSFLKTVLAIAKHRGRKGKFKRYGVADRLRK